MSGQDRSNGARRRGFERHTTAEIQTQKAILCLLNFLFKRSQIIRMMCVYVYECFTGLMVGLHLLVQHDDETLNGRFT
jgi:hypothetical protein